MKVQTDKMNLNRRQFLTTASAGTAALMLPWQLRAQEEAKTTLALIRGGTPVERLTAALDALGGLSQFSPKGKQIVVKPNIGWDRTPAQGANTDPELVGAVVRALKDAGADISVFDFTCNTAQRCYRRSGIEEAAKAAGAKVTHIHEKRFDEIKIPAGKLLQKWGIYRDYLEADLRINMPILKHHTLAGISMGLKNLMGVMEDSRPSLHNNFDEKLIDITSQILPELTIMDARRVLRRNGPQGGNVDDVEELNCLIAGFDPIAVDGEGARLFGREPSDFGHLVEAENRGLGSTSRPQGFREINLS
ncbi:DUF362 domain-containing protein [bacterium]|nr:DUF362 domain-containing protein [bacterium]